MSSILTNTSAMVAMQTLKGLGRGMNDVSSQISTGLKISSAKDAASTWAIAETMRSDVSSFMKISDGLATAQAAVKTGYDASSKIIDSLKDMKDEIVASMTPGAQIAKHTTNVTNLRNSIAGFVDAASFNGLNFVNSAAGSEVLMSVDRQAAGGVTASTITVAGTDLSAGTPGAARGGLDGSLGVTADDDHFTFGIDAAAAAPAISATPGTTDTQMTIDDALLAAGDRIEVTIGDKTASYTVTANDVAAADTANVVAVKMKSAIENLGVAGITVDFDGDTAAGVLWFGNNGAGAVDQTISGSVTPTGTGGLSALNNIDLSNQANREAALTTVETALTTAIDAAARLGSSLKQLDNQQDFINKLSDSVEAGIGSMVDADMEKASARLAALQTQQQLGIQSLSIANQAPQNLLALFR